MTRFKQQGRRESTATARNQGFSVLEILLVVVILGIVTTFVLMNTAQVRESFQLSGNGDIFKSYLEKAFTDARRRHALGSDRSSVTVTGPASYQVKTDFDGNGSPDIKNIALTGNVKFIYDPASPPTATIDWRGNVAEGSVTFQLQSRTNELLTLNLSSSGDSTKNPDFPSMPVITVTTTSGDVKTSAVVNGNYAPNPNPSPTPTPTPLTVCTGTQLPGTNNCCCAAGKTIDSGGKCH